MMTLMESMIESLSQPVPSEDEMIEADAQRMLRGTFWHLPPMTNRERDEYMRKVMSRYDELCAGG